MILNEVLPYVYSISGLGMACIIDSPLSFYSGIAFMLLACLIWVQRMEHRQGQSSDITKRPT